MVSYPDPMFRNAVGLSVKQSVWISWVWIVNPTNIII